jgi:hypothetical protein
MKELTKYSIVSKERGQYDVAAQAYQRWITQATICFKSSSVQPRLYKVKDNLVSMCILLLRGAFLLQA